MSLETQINSKGHFKCHPYKINDCDIKIIKQIEAISCHAPWTKVVYLKMDAKGRLQQKNRHYPRKSGTSWNQRNENVTSEIKQRLPRHNYRHKTKSCEFRKSSRPFSALRIGEEWTNNQSAPVAEYQQSGQEEF